MSINYNGWTLYDKIIIVEKNVLKYNYEKGFCEETGEKQGYIVDPKNKKQLENALSWARTSIYGYNSEMNRNEVIKEVEGIQHEFVNDGFEIELLDSAENSSQGGKLSFWNCKITKDSHSWIVGINADLLLRALISCTWINGRCTETVMFARCKGGVGILSRNSEEYIQAQQDMNTKANISKGKTTKYKLGHIYETLTESSVYFGPVYRWYEPLYESRGHYNIDKLVGFRLKSIPDRLELIVKNKPEHTRASDYTSDDILWTTLKAKCPSRKESSTMIEWNITIEDINNLLKDSSVYKTKYSVRNKYQLDPQHFGVNADMNNPPRYTEDEIKFFKAEFGIDVYQ